MAENHLTVDGDRLWSTIAASAEIGKIPNGGLCRLTLSPEDKAMRDVFAGWARDAGYGLTIDALGNMYVRREGRRADLAPVVIGSHLDTQARGGRFDGILGVLAGLEVLRTLDDRGIRTERPIEVVNWTNEEGARFQPPMLCSLAFAGGASVVWVRGQRDKAGVRFGDALDAIGYAGTAAVGGRSFDSYFELHIEQGPKLHAAGLPVGIVTGGYQTAAMRVSVRGRTSHVGPTPMSDRRNALVGAAHFVVAVDDIGWRYAPEDGKTTAARLDLAPNLPGLLSDEAEVYVDFRHPDGARLADMTREIEAAVAEAARRSRTEITIADRWGFGGLAFDAGLIALLRQTAADLAVPTMDIRSQAGHDAYHMAKICPAAMIFTPCIDGISHNEREDVVWADTLPGVNVLLNAVVARASRA